MFFIVFMFYKKLYSIEHIFMIMGYRVHGSFAESIYRVNIRALFYKGFDLIEAQSTIKQAVLPFGILCLHIKIGVINYCLKKNFRIFFMYCMIELCYWYFTKGPCAVNINFIAFNK